MKKYNVTVNGTAYEITLEVVDAADVKAAPAPAAAPAPVAAPAAPAGGETVNSPMPGTILSINVSNGSAVKKGDVLLLIEAMKLENEVNSPVEGEVTEIVVSKGQNVTNKQLLMKIK